jgi:hypothetical protein
MNARRSISMVLVWLCATAGGLLLCSAPALAQREHAFSKSFGSEGSGDGQMMRPAALAVSEVGPTNPLDPSAGDVYVVDTGHHLIDKFKLSGVYIGQITGTPTGSSFAHVNGVAVDSNGALPAIFGAPASATFSGTGNLSSVPPAAPSKSAKKKAVKHRKRAALAAGRPCPPGEQAFGGQPTAWAEHASRLSHAARAARCRRAARCEQARPRARRPGCLRAVRRSTLPAIRVLPRAGRCPGRR